MSDLVVQPGLVIPAAELRESASRSGGPGGQHVNKTSTRVTLRWNLRESTCVTPAQRSERLAELLRDALTPRRPRVPTRPSRASIERRLEAKRRRSAQKRLRRPDE